MILRRYLHTDPVAREIRTANLRLPLPVAAQSR
jgi:hypothetical protein